MDKQAYEIAANELILKSGIKEDDFVRMYCTSPFFSKAIDSIIYGADPIKIIYQFAEVINEQSNQIIELVERSGSNE